MKRNKKENIPDSLKATLYLTNLFIIFTELTKFSLTQEILQNVINVNQFWSILISGSMTTANLSFLRLYLKHKSELNTNQSSEQFETELYLNTATFISTLLQAAIIAFGGSHNKESFNQLSPEYTPVVILGIFILISTLQIVLTKNNAQKLKLFHTLTKK